MPEIIDGNKVIEEWLLTKGEDIVSDDMTILFKPLVDFGLIVYDKRVNTTNRFAMQFDLEKFFMRESLAIKRDHYVVRVRVKKEIFERVKSINDKYRNGQQID